ncbi:anti-CBASS protein Acb1 family protein [Lichenibacterium minor]|nr:anti-CBASS Acb1 family protein [Lichenibacterium minor]
MIAAQQELDLRPQLERLDRLICRSEGIDPGALTFAFRPLWQLDEPAKAALALALALALSKAQATQIYAGLGLWPAEVTAKLVEAQLIADGTYPNATAVFAESGTSAPDGVTPTLDFDPAEPRDLRNRWTRGGGRAGTAACVARAPGQGQAEASHPPLSLSGLLGLLNPIGTAQAAVWEHRRLYTALLKRALRSVYGKGDGPDRGGAAGSQDVPPLYQSGQDHNSRYRHFLSHFLRRGSRPMA